MLDILTFYFQPHSAGYQGWLHLSSITNNAAMVILVSGLLWTYEQTPLKYMPRSEIVKTKGDTRVHHIQLVLHRRIQPASQWGLKNRPHPLAHVMPMLSGGRHVLSFPPKLCSLVKPWAYRLWLSRGYALFKFILWWTVFSKGTKVPSSLAEALGTWLHQVLLDGTPELLPYATFQGVPYSHPYQHAVVYLFINSHIVFTKCQILFSGPYKYWFI